MSRQYGTAAERIANARSALRSARETLERSESFNADEYAERDIALAQHHLAAAEELGASAMQLRMLRAQIATAERELEKWRRAGIDGAPRAGINGLAGLAAGIGRLLGLGTHDDDEPNAQRGFEVVSRLRDRGWDDVLIDTDANNADGYTDEVFRMGAELTESEALDVLEYLGNVDPNAVEVGLDDAGDDAALNDQAAWSIAQHFLA